MQAPPNAAKRPSRTGPELLRVALFSRQARQAWGLALVLLLAFVLYSALTPQPHAPSLGWDKANHAVAFATLAFCGLLALRERPRHLFWVSFLLFALGAAIEIVQAYVPGRSPDSMDVVADAVGIALGASFGLALARSLDRRRTPRGVRR